MTLSEQLATEAFVNLADNDAADLLNTPNASTYGTKRKAVPCSAALAILLAGGSWPRFVIGAQASGPAQGLCVIIHDALTLLTTLSTDDDHFYSTIDSALAQAVGAGLLDAPTKATLMALAEVPKSWADVNNGGLPVTARDVGLARGAK